MSHRSLEIIALCPLSSWLMPLAGTSVPPFTPQGHYTLIAKESHFHSPFAGNPCWRRWSSFQTPTRSITTCSHYLRANGSILGLYEAGSSKSVTFQREGVSYIFCNIHPEMSAVVLALSTPLYAIADLPMRLPCTEFPGRLQVAHLDRRCASIVLDGLSRTVHVSGREVDLGTVNAPIVQPRDMPHMNKFGDPYDTESQTDVLRPGVRSYLPAPAADPDRPLVTLQ